MGRRKIMIKQIPDVKLRHITFNKRKNGLFKKAAELSVLCNLNLLLVCEDGLGNVIQFSKNKLDDIGSFLSQCNYQNLIDLTSEDYPDFAKINKKKDKDHNDSESVDDDSTPQESQPSQKNEKNARSFQQMEAQHKETAKMNKNMAPENRVVNENQIDKSRIKSHKGTNGIGAMNQEQKVQVVPSQNELSQKKNKNKMNLRLNIPKQEIANEAQNSQQQIFPIEAGIRMPTANTNDAIGMANERIRKQNEFAQAQVQAQMQNQMQNQMQARSMDKQQIDFTSPAFMPYMDYKRLGNMYEPPMSSPFKFYQNSRMEPSLSSVLKGISPFNFPIGGTPLLPKMNLGEVEALESANALRFMSRAGMGQEQINSAHSNHSNKVFTFQPEDATNSMNQLSNRNEMLMAAQRPLQNANQLMQMQMQDYINLPSAKSEPEYEMMNLPPDTLSARRFNFDGYFKEFDENGYGDLRKKYKLS